MTAVICDLAGEQATLEVLRKRSAPFNTTIKMDGNKAVFSAS